MTEPPTPDALPEAAEFSPKQARKLVDRYRITDGKTFRLKDHDPADTAGLSLDKKEARLLLDGGIERLIALQERLYAHGRWAVLCCFQAMDAAGKDSTIKHVMSGVNPQGVEVTSFKAPGPEDLSQDFLWRINRALPERGRIGIFNRSHYEEVLVVRVHPEMLERQRLPKGRVTKHIWDERLQAIAAYETYLARQGTVVLKFFLHLSRGEQRKRFLARLETPSKNWKFEPADLAERSFWDAYMDAYQEAIRATATRDAPWFVIPADHKWFTRLLVVSAIVAALDELDLDFPHLGEEGKARLALARARLEDEADA